MPANIQVAGATADIKCRAAADHNLVVGRQAGVGLGNIAVSCS